MKLLMFSVYDSKAEAYIPPFYAGNEKLAQRVFRDAANNPDHNFCKNPSDYTLMEIGKWDDENAKIDALNTPKSYGLAMEYQQRSKDTTPIDLELVN